MENALTTPNPLEPVKQLVLDAVPSPLTKAMYGLALDEFFAWWAAAGRPAFSRAAVQSYRASLEERHLAPATINQRLAAIRKLAAEAAWNGLLDPAAAQGIKAVKGARVQGVRAGNWLNKKQAEQLIGVPDLATLKGKRDRAILALMIGAGLRRDEVARLTFDHIQQRDSRWCVVDLVGKHGRVRTVPLPAWAKIAIDQWAAAAEVDAGQVFRGVNKGDNLMPRDGLSSQGIWRCVETYAAQLRLKISPHDLRRTHAKLAHRGGVKLDQLQLALGHASLTTTERYLGVHQDLTDAPADYLHLDLAAGS